MIKNNKIYVIDDEPDILEVVKIILESEKYTVKTAEVYESIKELKRFSPGLIILDALLRGQTGKNVCREMKKDPEFKDVPIIILSALPLSKIRQVAAECGAAAFLPKPFDMDSLLSLVRRYLA